jgi:oxygen-independent coproporphyrinogen-3 oxidase
MIEKTTTAKRDFLANENMKPAGLYIHIPYCKRKCSYCNFYFSTNLSTKGGLLQALTKEIEMRAEEASPLAIQTIYLGGGTPSLMNVVELASLFNVIKSKYQIDPEAEITLEANPDDLTRDYLNQLTDLGINRLSIGVQSFFDADLSWMNRAHVAKQSHESIELTIKSNIKNFSIDLIYGLPGSNPDSWIKNLNIIRDYEVPHLSCYALTIEERTALSHRVKEKSLIIPEDSNTIEQMDALLDFCESNQYEAYEISNFAKEGFRSKHNSSYWKGIPYFGFGPAAHSYNNGIRRWNIANNALYIQTIEQNLPYYETETLSLKNQCNEYLMLQLRRIEGIDESYLLNQYEDYFPEIKSALQKQIDMGNIQIQNSNFILTRQGKHIADEVSAGLFVV